MEALYNDILEGSLSNLIMELIILVKPYSSFLVEGHECIKYEYAQENREQRMQILVLKL